MEVSLTEKMTFEDVNKVEEQKKKRLLLHSALLVSAAAILACTILLYEGPFAIWVHIFSLLILGIFYGLFFPASNHWSENKRFYYVLFCTILVDAGIIVAGTQMGSYSLEVCSSYAAAFLLPAIVLEAWSSFNRLSIQYEDAWYYTDEVPEKTLFLSWENVRVRLKIGMEGNNFVYTAMIPKHLTLGLGFYFAVEEQNRIGAVTTNLVNDEKKPYGWIFYTVDYNLWKRFLDPAKTLSENHLRSNATIVAKRLETAEAVQHFSNALPKQPIYDDEH